MHSVRAHAHTRTCTHAHMYMHTHSCTHERILTVNIHTVWHGITQIGPEKGAIHMATGAVINALWDLWAKREGKPLWRLLTDMEPELLVKCIDFRWISDALVIMPSHLVSSLYYRFPYFTAFACRTFLPQYKVDIKRKKCCCRCCCFTLRVC